MADFKQIDEARKIILGLEETATLGEIKNTYKRLVRWSGLSRPLFSNFKSIPSSLCKNRSLQF